MSTLKRKKRNSNKKARFSREFEIETATAITRFSDDALSSFTKKRGVGSEFFSFHEKKVFYSSKSDCFR